MAIMIGDKVRLKNITNKEIRSVQLRTDTWRRYNDTIFTVVGRPYYKHPPSTDKHELGKIIYIESIFKDNNTSFCWWVYEKFVTPVQKQLTFVFTE